MHYYVIAIMAISYITILTANQNLEDLLKQAEHHYYNHEYATSLSYFEQARALQPDNATLLFNTGLLEYLLNNYDQALSHFDVAITHCPDYQKAQHYRLLTLFDAATHAIHQHQLDRAVSYYQHILLHHPDHVDTLYNLAYVLRLQGKDYESLPYYEKVISLQPDHEQAHLGFSKALLATGDFARGWQEFEWRFANSATCIKELGHHAITLENISGKRIILRAEWGFGDTIQFIRYAVLLKQYNAYVIAQVDAALIPLLSSCPYVDHLVGIGEPLPAFDYQIPLLSLPRLFATSLHTIPTPIPYLHASHERIAYWRTHLAHDKNFKIGICWQAKPDIFIEQSPTTKRSVPLALLAQLAELDGVSLYSLQQQHGLEQLDQLPHHLHVHTFDNTFDQLHGRYIDTAAVMHELDLIISVDTSVIHVAGALGKPVWVLLPYVAEWRWLHERPDSPWYPKMTLFRQTTSGDWQSVIQHIKQEISHLLSNK